MHFALPYFYSPSVKNYLLMPLLSGTIPLARTASCLLLAKVKHWHGSGSFALVDRSGLLELADGSG